MKNKTNQKKNRKKERKKMTKKNQNSRKLFLTSANETATTNKQARK